MRFSSVALLLVIGCSTSQRTTRVSIATSALHQALANADLITVEGACQSGEQLGPYSIPLSEEAASFELPVPSCGPAVLTLLGSRTVTSKDALGAAAEELRAAYFGQAEAVLEAGDVDVTFVVDRVGQLRVGIDPKATIDRCSFDILRSSSGLSGELLSTLEVSRAGAFTLLLPGPYFGGCQGDTPQPFDVAFAEQTTLTIHDDDPIGAQLIVTDLGDITEGSPAKMLVSLATEPSAPVTVSVGAITPASLAATPAALTFDGTNWDAPQSLSLEVVNDDAISGDRPFSFELSADSTDPLYKALPATVISGQIQDDDVADVEFVAIGPARTSEASDANNTTTFGIRLRAKPTATVTVSFSALPNAEASISPASYVFNDVDFANLKVVTLTGVDDLIDDDGKTYIIAMALTSADPNFDGVRSASPLFESWDDDVRLADVSSSMPPSPAGSVAPLIVGTTEPFATVEITAGECMPPVIATGVADAFGVFSIPVSVAANSSTLFFARSTSEHGYPSSNCGMSFSYQNDSSAPGLLTLSSTTPTSPSNVTTTPTIFGSSAETGARIRVYTNASCNEPNAGETIALSGAWNITASTQGVNSTVTYYAKQFDQAGNPGPCSTSSVDFTNDITPPAMPTVVGVAPTGPSTDQNPSVDVNAELNSTIAIYSDSGCMLVEGTAVATSSTTPVVVASIVNTTKTFYAQATDAANNASPCSLTNVSYTNDQLPPPAPLIPSLVASNGAVQASWGAVVDSLSTVTYELDHSTSVLDGTPEFSGLTMLTQTIPTLNCQTVYVAVRARDAAGNVGGAGSDYSPIASIDVTPPKPIIVGGRNGPHEVELEWLPVPGASNYEVCAAPAPGPADCASVTPDRIISVGTQTKLRIEGFPPGMQRYSVRAYWGSCASTSSDDYDTIIPYHLNLAGANSSLTSAAVEFFGTTTVLLPDLTGDNVMDIAVGVPNATVSANANQGRVDIYDGATRKLFRSFPGASVGDEFGAAVAAIDDVTGDGVQEIAVGAPGASGGIGKVYLLDVINRRTRFTATSLGSQRFGVSLARAPDRDADQRWDVLVGGSSTGAPGRAEILSSLSGSSLALRVGNPGTELGTAVACCIDSDDDGIPEIILGAPGANSTAGRILINEGSDALISSVLVDGPLGSSGRFGSAIAVVGDADGDGHTDFAVGAPTFDTIPGNDEGRVFLYSGSTLPPPPPRTLAGTTETYLGQALAAAGDIDDDGYADILAGAPGFAANNDGQVVVISGRTGKPMYRKAGALALTENLGASVAGGADLDGDGSPEIIVGSPNTSSGLGKVTILQAQNALRLSMAEAPNVFGKTGYDTGRIPALFGSLNYPLTLLGGTPAVSLSVLNAPSSGSVVGTSYFPGAAGNVDVLRATDAEQRQKDTRFAVRSINPAPTNAQSGGGFGDNMGKVIVALGDIDRDGVGDIGVGVPNSDVGSMNRGELKLISGASKMPIGVLAGPMVGDLRFGSAAAGAGDLNNDDRSEIVVGVPGDSGNLGSVQVFDPATPGSPLATLLGTGGEFGSTITVLGDIDFDGNVEIAVGAPQSAEGGSSRGRVDIIRFVLPSTLSVVRSYVGVTDFENFGATITVGDYDANGILEMVIGSPGTGEVSMWKTNAVTQVWKTGTMSASQRGAAIASIGDITGDGRTDFAVGAPSTSTTGLIEFFDGVSVGPSGPSGPPLRQYFGLDQLGATIGFLGKVDGAPLIVAGGNGRIQVVSALANPPPAPSSLRYERTDATGALFGQGIAVLGSLKDDESVTYIVGSPLADSGQTDGGRIDFFELSASPYLPNRPSKLIQTGAPTTTSIPLQWVDTTSDNMATMGFNENEDGYQVEYREPRGMWQAGPSFGPNVTTGSVAGLLPSHQYIIRVRATKANGHSLWSAELSASTQ